MRRGSSPARDDGGLGWAMVVEQRTVGRSWILFRGSQQSFRGWGRLRNKFGLREIEDSRITKEYLHELQIRE